jgi:hypothetical protein
MCRDCVMHPTRVRECLVRCLVSTLQPNSFKTHSCALGYEPDTGVGSFIKLIATACKKD